jgi:Tol biopolymer transport system component
VDELVWSPDGQYVAMRTRNFASPSGSDRDVVVRRVDGDSILDFATGSGSQRGPRFSPDGKWLLYVSDQSGHDEVYAESFPAGGNRLQISADGGREGVWSHDGTQVFYRAPDGWMMSAHLARGTPSQVTQRDRLFDASPYLTNQFLTMYDVAADGRFLMLRLDDQKTRTDVVIIRNWVEQVKARLAESSR